MASSTSVGNASDVAHSEQDPVRRMSVGHRYANLAAVVLPAAAVVAAAILTWGDGVDVADLVALVVAYTLSGLGITVGFHRLLTHRSFIAPRWFELTMAVLGTTTAQGPVIMWVADHRKHHAFADVDGDPHSPHTDDGSIIHGLWHAHLGWILRCHGTADWRRFAREMVDDRAMRRISRWAGAIVLASLALILAVGWLLEGPIGGARMLLWAGLVRIFLFQHFASFAVNSLCHTFGRRRFKTDDRSTNLAWLAVSSLGEAWHHNHHAFPRSASHGLRRREPDVSGYVIRALERIGLAQNVVRIPRAELHRRLETEPPSPARPISGFSSGRRDGAVTRRTHDLETALARGSHKPRNSDRDHRGVRESPPTGKPPA